MSFWTPIFIWCLGYLSQSTAASGKITLSALKSLKNCVEAEILPAVTHLWKPKPEHYFHKMKLSGQAAIRDGLTTNHDNSKLFSLALRKSQKTEDWNQNSSPALLKYKQCSSIGAGTKSGTKELLCISWFNLSFNGVMTFPRAVWAHSCGQGGGRFALTLNEANLQIFLRHHFHSQWGGKRCSDIPAKQRHFHLTREQSSSASSRLEMSPGMWSQQLKPGGFYYEI